MLALPTPTLTTFKLTQQMRYCRIAQRTIANAPKEITQMENEVANE